MRSLFQPADLTMSRIVRSVVTAQRRVLGVDASLTSTGYCFRDSHKLIKGTVKTDALRGPHRLYYVQQRIVKLVDDLQPDLVVLEDYAMGIGKGGMSFSIGELGGVLRLLFWERGIDVMLVSPTALKKAITGRGNADGTRKVNGRKVKDKSKPEMRAALLTNFNVIVDQGDEADACGLMLMGEMRYGSHTVSRAVQSTLRLDALNECSIIHGRPDLKSIARHTK
jgi:Holliday junction resolvasome RuvABC endonuclease subunit